MKRHSLEKQNERRKLYNELYVEKMLSEVNEKAEGRLNSRELVWHVMPLFETGHEKLANSILRNLSLYKCHFMPVQFTEIIMRYKDLVEQDVKEKMIEYIKIALEFQADERIHISMYNDNFANMAIYNLIVAGEMLGIDKYVQIGKEKLSEVCDLFRRCGVLMEYGSPTYTPIDTLCFAEIVNHAKDEEAKKMALMCEERMFLEICAQYHPETGRMAGPYSRAYAIDMVGHAHLHSGLLWKVFGDEVFINPVLDLFKPHENQVMHAGIEVLTLPNIAFITTVDYHCPDYLSDLMFNKNYPYESLFMTECTPSNATGHSLKDDSMHEYGGYRGTNQTYMTKEFSLGSAQSQFHEGALSESFYITYRNTDKAKRMFDTGVIYSRYIFNDKLPEQDKEYKIYGKSDYTSFRDEGRKFCMQNKNTVMAVYKPKHYEREEVTSAKLSIMIPIHFFDDFKIYAADEEITSYPFKSREMKNVFVKVHKSYFAFCPMEFTDHGREYAIKIEKANNHIMISFYNYEGEMRKFGIIETLTTSAGFINICATEDDYEKMEDFMEYANSGVLKDRMERSPYAYTRRIKYINRDTEFNFIYSPISEGIVVDTINKKPRGLNILKVDGIDTAEVPFMR